MTLFFVFLRLIFCRGVEALYDKGTHGQSLKDLESLTLWFSIVATPFHFASSAFTGVLARGAVQEGRIFSQTMRVVASVVLCTTLGLDTALISISLVNLIKKYKDEELSSFDVLQFSISVFFFTNTLIQPKTAHGVIERAQTMHFDQMANSMTDETAKATFDKFLKTNKVDGSIQERSKIVRTLNRMDDPNKFFKAAGSNPGADVLIGGRKGKTVLINGQRFKPNEYQATGHNVNDATPTNQPSLLNTNQPQVDERKRRECSGKETRVDIHRKKSLYNLDDIQLKNVSRKFCAIATNLPLIVKTARIIADNLECKSMEEFVTIVEIIANMYQGKTYQLFASLLLIPYNT